MNLDKLVGSLAQSGDPGAFLKQELEEGLTPITKRVDALEKKLDLILLSLRKIEAFLNKAQPILDLLKKLRFFK